LALAQVRFAPVYAVEQSAQIAEFQKRLGKRYVAQQISREAKSQGGAPGESTWLFRDSERGWTVSITSASLGLEAEAYVDFNDFAAELKQVLQDLEAVFEPGTEVRLGVRYINRIEDDRLPKRGIAFFVNEQLAGPVGRDLGNELQHSLCELRFRERGAWVVVRHGLIEPTAYLLDFDHFVEGEKDFSPSDIVRRVNRFHGLIERLFVWSLSERYLKELKGTRP
jgi:uncharacterized protein (TIGR04255 family)